MRILLIGSRGRSQAIAQALTSNKGVKLYALMEGLNHRIADSCHHYELDDVADLDVIDDFVERHQIEMIVVVSLKAQLKGVVNYFNEIGIPTLGATALCAWLEADKAFFRSLLEDNDIEGNPGFRVFFEKDQAVEYIHAVDFPVVVKPAGLTLQPGVKVEGIHLKGKEQVEAYVRQIFDEGIGNMPSVVIEPKLLGQEYIIQVLTDGKTIIPFPVVKEFNLLYGSGMMGNVHGVGSYSDVNHRLPFLDQQAFNDSMLVIRRVLTALKEQYSEGYKGILAAKFMITHQGIRLLGMNVGPDDPAIMNVLPLLKSDFLEICKAIADERLEQVVVDFEPLATVCKYIIPQSSPGPTGNVLVRKDDRKIADMGLRLWQSCFQVQENVYQPGPGLFAISSTGRNIEEAYRKCSKGLNFLSCEPSARQQKMGRIR